MTSASFEDVRDFNAPTPVIHPGFGMYEPRPTNGTPEELAAYAQRVAPFEATLFDDYNPSELSICLRRLAKPEYTIRRGLIPADDRRLVYNWMIAVRFDTENCGRCVAWSSLAMRYFDRYLDRQPDFDLGGKFQLLAIACLTVAARLVDFGQGSDWMAPRSPCLTFKTGHFHSSVTGFAFSAEQIAAMEWHLTFTLNFSLSDVTAIQLIYLPSVIETLDTVALACLEFLVDVFTSHVDYPKYGVLTVANACLLYLYGIELCDEDSITVLPSTPSDKECLTVLWNMLRPRPSLVDSDFIVAYPVEHVSALLDVLSADQSRGILAVTALPAPSSFSPSLSVQPPTHSGKHGRRASLPSSRSPETYQDLLREEAIQRVWLYENKTGGSEFQGPFRPALRETAPRSKYARRSEDSPLECQLIEFPAIPLDFQSPSQESHTPPLCSSLPDLGPTFDSRDRGTDGVRVGDGETGLAPMCE